jgi:serpin B
MKNVLHLAGVLSILLALFITGASAQSEPDLLVRDNTAFALKLYRQVSGTNGNCFFSPYSISTALAMTYAGARGETEKQMASALCFSLPQADLHPAFSKLESDVKAAQKEGIALSVANSLWPHKDYPFKDEYLSLIKREYGVSVTPVDYVKETEKARTAINDWVADRTQDKIRDLIQPGILDPLTRLVLVNAIYFKGKWEQSFKASDTREASFFTAPGQAVTCQLMARKVKARYATFPALDVLELPYAGGGMSMAVLLPKEADGLPKLEQELSPENLARWLGEAREQDVVVFLPRFRMTSLFRLDGTLTAMGMPDAFSRKSDFSGMDGTRDLYIGAVIHKAFVDVNEEGTEAAAATAVVMQLRSMPKPSPVFRADHPFVFLIRENRTGSILFMGRVSDPS